MGARYRFRHSLAYAAALVAPIALYSAAGLSAQSIGIAIANRSLQPGELIVVTLSFPASPSAVRLTAFGKNIPTYPAGDSERRALVGIDVEQAPGTYDLTVTARVGGAALRETRTLTVLSKMFPTRTLKVSPDFVTPPASAQERIAREAKLINSVYARPASERLWQTPFVLPVTEPPNSSFGQRSVFNGQPRSRHTGTDFASPAGTPIKAPAAGRIALAEDLYFSGKTVVIDHGLGLFSTLAHQSRIDVRQGEMVTAGQVIGLVGATGRVTGPHLHWALRAAGARVDPLSALALLGNAP